MCQKWCLKLHIFWGGRWPRLTAPSTFHLVKCTPMLLLVTKEPAKAICWPAGTKTNFESLDFAALKLNLADSLKGGKRTHINMHCHGPDNGVPVEALSR